ncbi:MAG: helicase-related protein [Candidatus Bilamarchaeaceae archaeon]
MKLTPRAYQLAIYNSILEKGNTLVVLPTGMGKTLIALMLIDKYYKEGKCLFLTPTKPLAKQHYDSVISTLGLSENEVALITGDKPPEKRKEMYQKSVIVATPQTVRNDIESGICDRNCALLVVDECHRAVGDYAYVPIAKALKGALIVGMTASPGGKKERIAEVLENLMLQNVEIRTSEDADVKPYIRKSTIKWVQVELSPALKKIKSDLDTLISSYAKELSAIGFPPPMKHKGLFLQLREKILNSKGKHKYYALVKYSALLNVLHMAELLETQGIYPMRNYLARLEERKTRSAKMLLRNPVFSEIKKMVLTTEEEHPKIKKLLEVVKSLNDKKMIVFAQYRDQIKKIEEELRAAGLNARQFVGKKDGITRKMQEETIADFRNNKFNILVASSIGEEGLDIPKVDAVIFYEPIPSEIRSIQRRGRAARLHEGEVHILMTRGTRDEYYYWASINKEKKMKQILYSIQSSIQKKTGRASEKPNETTSKQKKFHMGQTKISHFI